MAVQLPLVSVLMFGATALMLASAALAWRNQAVPGARAFVAFMLCAAAWAGTYGLQLVFTTLPAQLFWNNTQYPAGLLTCVAFSVFVLHYTGRDHRLTRPRLAALTAVTLLTSVVVWIPGLRWLVWRRASLVPVGEFVVADITHGPLFDLAVGYSYLVVLAGLGLLGLTTLRTRALYQKQTALVTVGAVVPLLGGVVAYLLELTVIDYTPVGLAVFGIGVAVALTRYQLLDVYPVPRNSIIDQIGTGIVVTDANDRIVDINPEAARLLATESAVSRPLTALAADATAEMAAMDPETTAELAVGDGYFECAKSTLSAPGGFGETRLYILTEVTERRERRRALESKNDRLDSFAEVLSHDLRNPLSVASGAAQLADTKGETDHLGRVHEAHDRMSEIIDDMLTLARSGEAVSEPEAVALETVAREAWAVVATDEATLTVAGTTSLRADPRRLQQLFENLFRNAVEHGGCEVAVRVGTTETGFFVADDGPGIPAAERAEVFRSGVSSTADGTGVGLAIVKTVVDGHGWDITVTEGERGGARFDVETTSA